MSPRRLFNGVGAALLVSTVVGCSSGGADRDANATTTTAPSASPLRRQPLPAPVEIAPDAQMELADPAFDPLPGAQAHYGTLGGTAYRIEMPDDWNGVLVMWMHGFGELQPEARVDAPDFRRSLIDGRVAWAASSFSSTSMIPSLAADETAALWDHFVDEFGRPRWTYATGLSMGGWAAHISAERYGNRYDGALGLCGAVGAESGLRVSIDQLTAAAYLAGVTQADIDESDDLPGLFNNRVGPRLDDPETRAEFIELAVALTGGPRRFAADGIEQELRTNWERGLLLIAAGLVPPRTASYELPGVADEVADALNRAAIQLPANRDALAEFTRGMDQQGRLAMPLLTMHTTGDGQVPIGQAVALRKLVDRAGASELLVQRVIEDSGHCGFTTAEQEAAFNALRAWVESGPRPAGTDLGRDNLTALDQTFELQSRDHDPGDTITVAGTATLDGAPLDADFVGAVVVDDGLVTPCQAEIPSVWRGDLEIGILTASASRGCARENTEIVLWTYVDDRRLFAEPILLRTIASTLPTEIVFATDKPRANLPPTTDLHGEVFDGNGDQVSSGTIEARVGNALCGVASIRNHGSFNGYIMSILRSDRCPPDAQVEFTIDGLAATPGIPNTDRGRDALDLTLTA